jgi:biopolymer transport protein ExbB
MSIIDFFIKGGWLMVPLVLLSILALYAIIERLITLNKRTKVSQKWLNSLYNQVLTGKTEEAKLLCEQNHTAIAHVLQAGLENLPYGLSNMEKSMELAGQNEVYQLERNLSFLAAIAAVAPMLGFLGTVLGMIEAFRSMAQATTAVTPQLLAGGIYEAMITTAAGLVVGVLADAGYRYILTQVNKTAYKIEQAGGQLIEILQESHKMQQAPSRKS